MIKCSMFFNTSLLLLLLVLSSMRITVHADGLRGTSNNFDPSNGDLVTCNGQFGNPCGPMHHCIQTGENFQCMPKEGIEQCNVNCGAGSTCVRDLSNGRFDCKCDYGYQKPDPYFDCVMMEGFQVKSVAKVI